MPAPGLESVARLDVVLPLSILPLKGKHETLACKVHVIFETNLSLSAKCVAATSYLSPNLS